MGVTAKINGREPQVTDYSYQADVVSPNPANTSAGIGGLSLNMPLVNSGLEDQWNLLYGDTLDLSDNGSQTRSTIVNMSLSDYSGLALSGESPLRALQAVTTVQPFRGTLPACIEHFFNTIDSVFTLQFDPSVPNTPNVVVPAYYGAVWPYLRDFLSVYRVELVLGAANNVIFRAMDSIGVMYDLSTSQPNPISRGETVSGDHVVELVEIEYFGNQYVTNGTAYPVKDEDPSVVSVKAGETAVIELTTKTGLSSVNNPTAVDWIGPEYTGEGTVGAYTVAGDDGLPVKASAWIAAGGSVTATVKPDDPYTIILTVQAPTSGILATVDSRNTAAPYHLAMTDGELYPRLFLTGTGVRTEQQELVLNTGASDVLAEKGIGFTLSNRHVGTLAQAYDVGLKVAQYYSSPTPAMSRTAPYKISDNFTQTQGSKFRGKDQMYRVDSVSYRKGGVDITGTLHTTIEDFNDEWATRPHTIADFNAYWGAQQKHRAQDFAVAPLR